MASIRPDMSGWGRSLLEKSPIPACAKARFLVADRKATLRNLRMVAVLTSILVPFFSIVDFFAYREHFELFLFFRLSCTGLVLLIWRWSRSSVGKRFYRVFTVFLPMIPAFFIALMIGVSLDPGSPYYAGLSLCLAAIGFVFHWSYREALISSVLVLLMYLLACLPAVLLKTSPEGAFAFVNNLIFILATGVVVTTGSFAHHKIRLGEFLAKDQLRRSQTDLASKNLELCHLLDELRETESQLIQSEKMASLGQLSAGVIHEIGNPLNFSNQALFLLQKKLRNSGIDNAVEIIEDVREGHDRIKDIVSELRDFSHKSTANDGSYAVEESIHSALRMLGKQLEAIHVDVVVDAEGGLQVVGVKNQITQVIMNLVQNAVHAVESLPANEPGKVWIESTKSEGEVKISVSDNGKGIDSKNLERIFDPFFTTKEVGKGTGLGLSICYRIIEAHNGNIEAESDPGGLTRFTISLPEYNYVSSTKIHQETL